MQNRINQIMELDNGDSYIVMKQAIYKNENYYVVAKVIDDTDIDDEDLKVLHEFDKDGASAVEEVTDPELFKLVVKYVGLEEE